MKRIKLALARASTLISAVLFYTWLAVKALVAAIGATTATDDYNLFIERLPKWADWLFSTPWWVPAALATILTLFLIWLSWPKPPVREFHKSEDRTIGPAADETVGRSEYQATLNDGLYIGEIRFTFEDLPDNRHSEITIRIFNGTGKTVNLHGLSGKIAFAAPNSDDPRFCGELPEPTIRNDTARKVSPLQEWFLILEQKVPAEQADKLLAMMASNVRVLLYLTQLDIEVFSDDPEKTERLKMWGGVSYDKLYGFNRIIMMTAEQAISAANGV